MLNNVKIKNLKPKEKPYKVVDSDGLYIEVRPTGKKIWRVRRKTKDKDTVITLGEYPEIDLKSARLKGDEVVESESLEHGDKFEKIARDWVEHRGFASEKNKSIVVRRFENYVFPDIGSMYIKQIKPADILPILKKIESRGYLELARRVQGVISQVFRYGIRNLLCEGDPASLPERVNLF